MSDPAISAKADAFLEFLSEMFRYRRRMMDLHTEEMQGIKQYFEKLRFGDGRRGAEPDLFFRTGQLLSQSKEPVTMGEIGKTLEVSLSACTRLVDMLVENGLAERVDDPTDRRVVRVALTAEGHQVFETMFANIHEQVSRFLSNLTTDEIDQLLFLLRKAFAGLHQS